MKRLLLQLDGDRLPSAFDQVVAYDAGAARVLSYGGVTPEDVRGLAHGAIFTRGPKELHHTAIFIGGANIARAEQMLDAVQKAFFGPFRVSVMLDPNGSNTTAAAAVWKMVQAVGGDIRGRRAAVFAGTGPVGARAAGLLTRLGAEVRITSRSQESGDQAAASIAERFGGTVTAFVARDDAQAAQVLDGVDLVLASGPEGVQMISHKAWIGSPGLRVVADVNAVPPLGIEGVEANDDDEEREGRRVFGALGIGGLKMKLHKACIARMFERDDLVLDAESIYDLATEL